MTAPDPWAPLRRHTAARIALGRAGVSLPTTEWQRFALAHALARDAVHEPFDSARLAAEMQRDGFDSVTLASAAADRATYLRRPDLGRRLSARSAALLAALATAPQIDGPALAVVVGDGLSARAVHGHALPLLRELRPLLEAQGQPPHPVLLVHQCRVALGDEAGGLLRAAAVLVLIGERPGLSSPDSLGAYLSWAPRPGLADAQRNCVSNIRPAGLPCAEAARKIAWLLGAARRLGATGVALKDESDKDGEAALPGAGLSPQLP
ncbi:MAG: ethanolamine ammonia-lyase [Leptothrix sp. (in: Bacteria)]|nr:ethanolamine ammonia-lyase [Leptothrix sp. (in: b-proteobacteria)]